MTASPFTAPWLSASPTHPWRWSSRRAEPGRGRHAPSAGPAHPDDPGQGAPGLAKGGRLRPALTRGNRHIPLVVCEKGCWGAQAGVGAARHASCRTTRAAQRRAHKALSQATRSRRLWPAAARMALIIGAMAELESSLISERVTAGMRAAEARGKHLGRPAIP